MGTIVTLTLGDSIHKHLWDTCHVTRLVFQRQKENSKVLKSRGVSEVLKDWERRGWESRVPLRENGFWVALRKVYMRTQRGLLCGFSYFKYTGIRAVPTVSWIASWKQKHSDSLSEGVIHLIKSKTFCSKKAFLGNKSNSEVRSSVEGVKTRTLWKRSLSHAPFGGHHLRVQISCVVNVFYGQGRCHVVHWSYIAESTNSENLFKYLLCAEHFLWHLGSKCLQYPRENELKHSCKCSRDKVWRSAEGSVGASSPAPEQDGAVVAHSELSLQSCSGGSQAARKGQGDGEGAEAGRGRVGGPAGC